MKTCSECGGTGRCYHCHGTGVLAPVFWHEGSRGPGEGLRCPYCSPCGSGDCSFCLGAGKVEFGQPREKEAPTAGPPRRPVHRT